MSAFHFGKVTAAEVRGTRLDASNETTVNLTLKNRTRGTEVTLEITRSQLESILKSCGQRRMKYLATSLENVEKIFTDYAEAAAFDAYHEPMEITPDEQTQQTV